MTARVSALPFVLALAACAHAPPLPPEAPREGWLHDLGLPVPLREATACERAAAIDPSEPENDRAEGIARTLDADLDGDGRDERVVIAIRRETLVAVTDGACALRWRGVHDGRDAAMVGPTVPGAPWAAVPPEEVRQLYASDRLPSGGTMQLHLVRGTGGHRHVILMQTGAVGALMYGWRALVVSCHAGRCRGDRIGHREWAPLPPPLGCGPTARAFRPPPRGGRRSCRGARQARGRQSHHPQSSRRHAAVRGRPPRDAYSGRGRRAATTSNCTRAPASVRTCILYISLIT